MTNRSQTRVIFILDGGNDLETYDTQDYGSGRSPHGFKVEYDFDRFRWRGEVRGVASAGRKIEFALDHAQHLVSLSGVCKNVARRSGLVIPDGAYKYQNRGMLSMKVID